ncbi:hypothetical protein DPMN_054366 [Dreissena polymorpha]|uniref:Uncharacterized protein n=1 Tax=Dreissena polymorpha TaxID=45954 RepID=A0A9D4HRK1_DREPO|nr:hypothetical protein DPMN_054366 [Dreissena polymorpha]
MFFQISIHPKTREVRQTHGRTVLVSATDVSHRSIILIIAYMRTGSTLTGSFLRQSERSFYIFEPLHNLAQAFENAEKKTFDSVTLKYVDGTRYTIYMHFFA